MTSHAVLQWSGLRRARWREPVALAVLLIASGVLYLNGLGQTGWANAFYSAAAQAGADNWTAFLFGSLDAGNAITVDKPPASIWLMALSVRAFGLSPASILLPEALCGVAAVALTYLLVRRHHSTGTALLAGALLAVTPAAALIFRYNNPDALLVVLVTLGLYATVRALGDTRVRWLLLIGGAFGFAFLTKQLQALIAAPIVAGVYLWAGPGTLKRRLSRGAIALGAMIVSAGWWVAIVLLVPSGQRPWIGGTADDNFLSLTLGYNGLGRILGGDGNGSSSNATGIDRLLAGQSGWLIGWLLPAAIALAVVALVITRNAPRTDPARATLVLATGATILTAGALSFMSGIFHAYYSVAVAPSMCACVAIGAGTLWTTRTRATSRIALAGITAGTGLWGGILLDLGGLTAFGVPTLVWIVTALIAGGMIVNAHRSNTIASLAVVLGIAVTAAGPLAASIATASAGHSGSSASAVATGSVDDSLTAGIDPLVIATLEQSGARFRWAAATGAGSNSAARYQLTGGEPVMAIGGYKRTDPSPTLAQFQSYVSSHQVHWYIGIDSKPIGEWVAANFAPQCIGGTTLFDLTAAPASQPKRAVAGAVV